MAVNVDTIIRIITVLIALFNAIIGYFWGRRGDGDQKKTQFWVHAETIFKAGIR